MDPGAGSEIPRSVIAHDTLGVTAFISRLDCDSSISGNIVFPDPSLEEGSGHRSGK